MLEICIFLHHKAFEQFYLSICESIRMRIRCFNLFVAREKVKNRLSESEKTYEGNTTAFAKKRRLWIGHTILSIRECQTHSLGIEALGLFYQKAPAPLELGSSNEAVY